MTHSFPTRRSSDLLYANQTGMRVRAGQPLLSVYGPQLAAAQQEYRLADETARRLAESDPASAASMVRLRDAARTRLRNWEISDAQLGQTGLVLTAPADAVVIEKPVVRSEEHTSELQSLMRNSYAVFC